MKPDHAVQHILTEHVRALQNCVQNSEYMSLLLRLEVYLHGKDQLHRASPVGFSLLSSLRGRGSCDRELSTDSETKDGLDNDEHEDSCMR